MSAHILRRIQPLFGALALLFIALWLRAQWPALRAVTWRIQAGWLAGSAALLVASWAMEVAIWRRLLHWLDGDLPYGQAVRIWFVSAIMRYIPGNIWQPLSMTLQCRRFGIRPEATVTSIALYQAVILLAVLPMAAIYLAFSGDRGLLGDLLGGSAWWLAALGLLPLGLLLLRPGLLTQAINWGLHKLGRSMLAVQFTHRRLLAALTAAMLNWILWGASFAALTFALGVHSGAEMSALAVHLIVAYPVAYAVGFLSFFSPSGLGVREGAFFLLLAPLMDGGVVTVAALAMRVWTTLGELVMAAISVTAIAMPDGPSDPADAYVTRRARHEAG